MPEMGQVAETVGGIVLLGMPGAGKGTQALEIRDRYGIPEISTGEILRDHVERGTELGRAAEPIMKEGALVPDEILNGMVTERLSQPDCQPGFILDGYPRTEAQARFLDELMTSRQRRVPRVLLLDVPVERLVERLIQRRSCPQCGAIYNLHLRPPRVEGRCDDDGVELEHRLDDQEGTVRKRIETFQRKTAAVIEHYRQTGALIAVNSDRHPDEIAADIRVLLDQRAAA
jgi:adenylate kinase